MTTTGQLAAGTYAIDPSRSSVTAKGKGAFGLMPVTGTFALRSGTLVVADDLAHSSAVAVLDASSYDSKNTKRDHHVASADFLDVANHPDITFTSQAPTPHGDGWILPGELTVRGTTAPVELTVEPVSTTGPEITLRATTTISRYDFGVTKSKGMVGGSLALTLEVTAVRG